MISRNKIVFSSKAKIDTGLTTPKSMIKPKMKEPQQLPKYKPPTGSSKISQLWTSNASTRNASKSTQRRQVSVGVQKKNSSATKASTV